MKLPYRVTIEIAAQENGKGVGTITLTGDTEDLRPHPGKALAAFDATRMAAAILAEQAQKAAEITANRNEFEASMAFHNMPVSGRPN